MDGREIVSRGNDVEALAIERRHYDRKKYHRNCNSSPIKNMNFPWLPSLVRRYQTSQFTWWLGHPLLDFRIMRAIYQWVTLMTMVLIYRNIMFAPNYWCFIILNFRNTNERLFATLGQIRSQYYIYSPIRFSYCEQWDLIIATPFQSLSAFFFLQAEQV